MLWNGKAKILRACVRVWLSQCVCAHPMCVCFCEREHKSWRVQRMCVQRNRWNRTTQARSPFFATRGLEVAWLQKRGTSRFFLRWLQKTEQRKKITRCWIGNDRTRKKINFFFALWIIASLFIFRLQDIKNHPKRGTPKWALVLLRCKSNLSM